MIPNPGISCDQFRTPRTPAIVDGDVTVFDWALTFKTMQLGLEAQQVIARETPYAIAPGIDRHTAAKYAG
jgi:hypothetical protein